jgi:uncharacterized protein YggE
MKTLLCALVLTTSPAFAQQPQTPPPTPTIVTTGDGVVKKAPDRAFVSLASESRAKTAPEAQRLNVAAMNAVLDRIKALGIPADAIQTTGYNLQPDVEYQNGRQTVRGFIARNQVDVRIDTLAKLGDVVASAVESGATSVSGIRFDLKDRDGIEREALRLAVRDARGRADAMASGAGVQIGGVQRIDEQRDQPPMPRPYAMSMQMGAAREAAAPVPVEAGEIEIRAHVTLTVWIK